MIRIGDIIKSLDSAGQPSCYMIGKVEGFSCDNTLIQCKAIMRVFEDQVVPLQAKYFGVAIDGESFLDAKFPGRITIIS